MATNKPQSTRFAEVETKSDKPAYPPVLKHGGLRRVQDRSFDPQPIAIPAGTGRQFKFMGVTHKLTQPQTGGAFYLFEAEFEPETGNGLHVHHYEDEVVCVLQGGIEIKLDRKKLRASAAGIVHLPKNIPHALYNPLKTPLRILVMTVPGGMEYFFDELGTAKENGTLDDALHKKISRKYGIEWLE